MPNQPTTTTAAWRGILSDPMQAYFAGLLVGRALRAWCGAMPPALPMDDDRAIDVPNGWLVLIVTDNDYLYAPQRYQLAMGADPLVTILHIYATRHLRQCGQRIRGEVSQTVGERGTIYGIKSKGIPGGCCAGYLPSAEAMEEMIQHMADRLGL